MAMHGPRCRLFRILQTKNLGGYGDRHSGGGRGQGTLRELLLDTLVGHIVALWGQGITIDVVPIQELRLDLVHHGRAVLLSE